MKGNREAKKEKDRKKTRLREWNMSLEAGTGETEKEAVGDRQQRGKDRQTKRKTERKQG